MDGKVAIITGSSNGIGRETAILFASKGAKVVITGRNEDKVNEVVEACDDTSPNGSKALGIVGDVQNLDFLKTLIDTTVENFDEIHILVNNAGFGEITSIEDESLMEKYDEMMNTNVKAVVRLTQLALPHLIDTQGVIVNVSSLVAVKPYSNMLIYCMTKAALDMFTRCLSVQLTGKGVRVNSINPGYVPSGFQKRMAGDKIDEDTLNAGLEQLTAAAPLQRAGTVQEISKAIAFLVSDDSSYNNGSIMIVDGGLINV